MPRLVAFGAGAAAGLVGWRVVRDLLAEDLAGQVAFVTGGSRGLGLLLARELGRQACRVAICARDPDEVARAVADLESRGVTVVGRVCDVSDAEAVRATAGEIAERLGPIDVLVNNASILSVGPIATMAPADFVAAHEANFWGTVHPTLAVLPSMMSRRRGRIVNVTSIGGRIAAPHLLPYAAAKFATVGFSEGLRAELARHGVVVTTVVPWFMRTGSYLRAEFKEPQEAEYIWFSAAASLPGLSVDAERAARQIVAASRRGDALIDVGVMAILASRFHGLFPGLTADLLAVMARLLPREPDAATSRGASGVEIDRRRERPLLEWATTLGRSAARRFNQLGRIERS